MLKCTKSNKVRPKKVKKRGCIKYVKVLKAVKKRNNKVNLIN